MTWQSVKLLEDHVHVFTSWFLALLGLMFISPFSQVTIFLPSIHPIGEKDFYCTVIEMGESMALDTGKIKLIAVY